MWVSAFSSAAGLTSLARISISVLLNQPASLRAIANVNGSSPVAHAADQIAFREA